MAKKKAAATPSPISGKAVPAAPAKSTAQKSTAKKTANSPMPSNGDASSAADVLGTDQIGATAGAVWVLLTEKGDTSLATIIKEVDAPADLILAAVGWLAREEKLEFTASGKNVKLALK